MLIWSLRIHICNSPQQLERQEMTTQGPTAAQICPLLSLLGWYYQAWPKPNLTPAFIGISPACALVPSAWCHHCCCLAAGSTAFLLLIIIFHFYFFIFILSSLCLSRSVGLCLKFTSPVLLRAKFWTRAKPSQGLLGLVQWSRFQLMI